MAFCTKCGATVTGGFCGQCGTPVGAASQPAAPASSAPIPAPAVGGTAPSPRKTSPIVWVLVVILGIFVLGGLAIGGVALFVVHKAREAGVSSELLHRNPAAATARILAAANPDIEIVGQDDNAGTVTVRDRSTGRTTTWNLDQARRGRFSISAEDEDGKNATVEFGAGSPHKLPSWVPSYPGLSGTPTFGITGNGPDGAGGTIAFNTSDPPDQVLSFYQYKINALGMKVQVNTTTANGGVITAADDEDRSLNVVVNRSSGRTGVQVTYSSKR